MQLRKKLKRLGLKINKLIYRDKYFTVEKSYVWMFVAVALACLFVFVFSVYMLSVTGNLYAPASSIFEKATMYAPPDFSKDPMITVGKLRLKLTKPVIKNTDPYRGLLTAPIRIYEFSDFECKYCAQAQEVIEKVLEEYKGMVVLVWKDYPVTSLYENSRKAARAARCAQLQNKFWEFHDALFNREDRALSDNLYLEIAKDLNLKTSQFKECLESDLPDQLIDEDLQEGDDLQVYGVPLFIINNQELFGTASLEDFRRAIEIELNR